MSAIIVVLKCLTNMHVGNGEVNYNIIDNEVERDPVTGYPTINSSGVKGALREFLTSSLNENEIAEIFGGRVSKETTGHATQQGNAPQQGKLKFLPANMLAIPFRASSGRKPYYKITTPSSLKRFNDAIDLFDIAPDKKMVKESYTNIPPGIEGYTLPNQEPVDGKYSLERLGAHFTGMYAYPIEDEVFRSLALPVLARNCLEDGRSCNLWYEEVVPHKSVFYFPVVTEDVNNKWLARLTATLEGKVVQFGGNASIGYGLCKVSILQGASIQTK